ncbi:Ig-like domain-containing protein [Streptomyces sp. NPDC102360]|uniref:Ig-like domain-containing protein n=1 Tax=Streptomyces sp. NPDC102360 TaxID=3366160 RepID=UPI00381A6EB1
MPADSAPQWQSNNSHWQRHNRRLSKRAKAGIGGSALAGIIAFGIAAGSAAEGVGLDHTTATHDGIEQQADAQRSAVDKRVVAEKAAAAKAAAQKKAEAERKAEVAREKTAAEKKAAKDKAEAERKAEAARMKAAAEKKAEAKRKAEAKKKAEAKRKAELAKYKLVTNDWRIFADRGKSEASPVSEADIETDTWVKDKPHSWWKDLDEDPKLVKVGTPDHGSARMKGDTVVYTPNAGFLGDDSFTYTVKWKGHTETGTVIATVDKPYDYSDDSGSGSSSSSGGGGGHVSACAGSKHFKLCL